MTYKNRNLIFIGVFVVIGWLYGLSLSAGYNLAGFLGLIGVFVLFELARGFGSRFIFLSAFLYQLSLMYAASFWFKDIQALGWAEIAGISPKVWLMILVFPACAVCALFGAAIFWLVYRLARLKPASTILNIYIWSLALLAAELARAVVFSLIIRNKGMPVEPSMNLYSSALIVMNGNFEGAGKVLGLYGSSFLVYFISAGLGSIIIAKDRLKVLKSTGVVLVGLLLAVSLATNLRFGDETREEFSLVAVSDQVQKSKYLADLPAKLTPSGSKPMVVALPEYSNLLHPFTNTSAFSLNYDGRYDFPEQLQGKNVYLVGTEDEMHQGTRYAETYAVNSDLLKIKRQVKTFLIPGGEYIPSWVISLLNKFDQASVSSFLTTRGRQVIKGNPEPEVHDNTAEKIGIGACSALLKPFHYQTQVNQGALVLTSNVSFEQFDNAPQYQQFAHRYAGFITSSLERPMAIGARKSNAVIYGSNGRVITNQPELATTDVSVSRQKTIYALLGDKLIVLLLCLPLAVLLILRFARRNRHRD